MDCNSTKFTSILTPSTLDPQNFKKFRRPTGILGASLSRSAQCSLQKALPRIGELVQTSGRFRAENPGAVCWNCYHLFTHYY